MFSKYSLKITYDRFNVILTVVNQVEQFFLLWFYIVITRPKRLRTLFPSYSL